MVRFVSIHIAWFLVFHRRDMISSREFLTENRISNISNGRMNSSWCPSTSKMPPASLSQDLSWQIGFVVSQVGQGSTEDELRPCLVSSLGGLNIVGVAAGLWHTLCITDTGDIYAFGGNQFGQLGVGGNTAEVTFLTSKISSYYMNE